MMLVAAKEAEVCPDGNEKSTGRGISSGIEVFMLQGRILAINGFRITSPANVAKRLPKQS